MAFSYFVWIKHPTFLSIAFAVAQIRLSANNKIVDEVEKDPCVLFFLFLTSVPLSFLHEIDSFLFSLTY